jgi:hypothetical protein
MNLSSDAGVVNTTIDAALHAVSQKLGVHFSLETLTLDDAPNPEPFRPIDFSAITDGTDPVSFLEERFPAYKVTPDPDKPTFYRVFDIRLLQCPHYALGEQTGPITFNGAQQELITQLQQKVSAFQPIIAFSSGETQYSLSATHVSLNNVSGTLRDILYTASVLQAENSIVWRCWTSGTLDNAVTRGGFFGSPAFSPPE